MAFAQQNLKGTTDPMRWSFVEGRRFGHYKTYSNPVFLSSQNSAAALEPAVGVNYEGLTAVPSVNLLYMLSWDVVSFEEMASHIDQSFRGCKVGHAKEVRSISDTFAKLNFVGCTDGSFFRNGRFEAKLLVYGLAAAKPAAIFEYRCNGNLSVFAEQSAGTREQSGSSFYMGKLYIDVETADVVAGDMFEWITATLVNSKGKLIPQQKRRLIKLEKVA